MVRGGVNEAFRGGVDGGQVRESLLAEIGFATGRLLDASSVTFANGVSCPLPA